MPFQEVVKEAGVDEKNPLVWMMVPQGGFNYARLINADGLKLTAAQRNLVDIYDSADAKQSKVIETLLGATGFVPSPSQRVVVISSKSGAATGETLISGADARGAGKQNLLEVSVKPRRIVNAVINFVMHRNAKGEAVKHPTLVDPSMASGWIKGINDIYVPQANVEFKLPKPAAWVQYEKQFSPVIRPEDYPELFKKRTSGDVMNFFIVGEFERDSNPRSKGDISKGVTVDYKDIVCEEPADKDKHTMIQLMAHEALHFLLREGHHDFDKEKANWVMEQLDFQTGQKIPKVHANKINPAVAVKKKK